MDQYSKQTNSNINALEQAEKLRAEADAIEAKERMRRRLLELIEISQDPYYDQYLAQMMRDLDSGKATPGQIAREADRTYRLYQQRMGQTPAKMQQAIICPQPQKQKMNEKKSDSQQIESQDTVETKIGAGIFSAIGAVFVLAALVIFGFDFLEGIWREIYFYVVAVTAVLISELAVKRLSKKISIVISSIGISSLYITTIINYWALKNISGLIASAIIIVVAFFVINLVLILLPNQKDGTIIGGVHMVTLTGFTVAVMIMTLLDGMNVMFVSCFVVLSLILLNMIYLSQRNNLKEWYTILYAVFIGCFAVITICVAYYGQYLGSAEMQMFHKILIEVMAMAVAFVFFILWGKEKCRWIQYYFIVSMVMFLNGLTGYDLEMMIATLLVFVITRLLSYENELLPLDAILEVVVVIKGIAFAEKWYVIPFFIIMALSVFTIKRWHVFHEIMLTLFFFAVPVIYFDNEWMMPVSVGILFALFLLFNHLPGFNCKEQLSYNVTNVVFSGIILLLYPMLCDDYRINSLSMIIGAVAFWGVFRERYGMIIPMKQMFLAMYLCFMICRSGFETPVVVSILLMIVAIACVVGGLRTKDKACRICGLVIALIVSVKMIIYDFEDLDSMAKAILFLIVGIITIAISFLYIFSGKKKDEKVIENFVQEETKELNDVNSKERIGAE